MAQSSTGDDASGTQSSRSAWSTGLGVTSAVVLFMVLRLFAVSYYDWHTAFTVMGTIGVDDAPTVVVGTLMADPAITGWALVLLLPVTLMQQIRQRARHIRDAGIIAWLFVLLAVTIALVGTFQMWWVLLGMAVHMGVLALLLYTRRKGVGYRTVRWIVHRAMAGTLLVTLLLALVVTTPWMSREHISLKDKTTLDGYVIEVRSGYLTVLTRSDREIEIVPNSKVTGRKEVE